MEHGTHQWNIANGTITFRVPAADTCTGSHDDTYDDRDDRDGDDRYDGDDSASWADLDLSAKVFEVLAGFDLDSISGLLDGTADGIGDGAGADRHAGIVPAGPAHRTWWYIADDCDGHSCDCGPRTLLDALSVIDADRRGEAVKVHADEMRALYEHFWSGQGLLAGTSTRIGDACADCLTIGTHHVWDIYEHACDLAEEFGEALAAFAYELFVGEPRHNADHGTN